MFIIPIFRVRVDFSYVYFICIYKMGCVWGVSCTDLGLSKWVYSRLQNWNPISVTFMRVSTLTFRKSAIIWVTQFQNSLCPNKMLLLLCKLIKVLAICTYFRPVLKVLIFHLTIILKTRYSYRTCHVHSINSSVFCYVKLLDHKPLCPIVFYCSFSQSDPFVVMSNMPHQ